MNPRSGIVVGVRFESVETFRRWHCHTQRRDRLRGDRIKSLGLRTYRTSCINATDSKCRRAIKPKAQNLSTLSANARGDDILNRSRSACAEGTCVNASRELQSGKQTANAPSAFRVTATSSSSQGGREERYKTPVGLLVRNMIQYSHLTGKRGLT